MQPTPLVSMTRLRHRMASSLGHTIFHPLNLICTYILLLIRYLLSKHNRTRYFYCRLDQEQQETPRFFSNWTLLTPTRPSEIFSRIRSCIGMAKTSSIYKRSASVGSSWAEYLLLKSEPQPLWFSSPLLDHQLVISTLIGFQPQTKPLSVQHNLLLVPSRWDRLCRWLLARWSRSWYDQRTLDLW